MSEITEIETTRFGEVQISKQDIYTFDDGILGFPNVEEYVLLENPSGGPFRWLQSVDRPGLAFVVCDPMQFYPDYQVDIPGARAEELGIASAEEAFVLVIVTVRSEKEQITANFQGPLIFNPDKNKALQHVLTSGKYTTKHYLFAGDDHEPGDPVEGGS